MSCKCQECGKQYTVDLIIPDSLWERIRPVNKPVGSGMFCGSCIMTKVENLGEYDCLQVLE